MRKHMLVCVLAVSMVLLGTATACAFQNEPEGFRGVEWGDTPTEDMVSLGQVGETYGYTRASDNMNIGNVALTRLFYIFTTDTPHEFMGVIMWTNSKSNYSELLDILTVRYGDPVTAGLYQRTWTGNIAAVDLDYDIVEDEASFSIYNMPRLVRTAEQAKQKAAEEAAGDF